MPNSNPSPTISTTHARVTGMFASTLGCQEPERRSRRRIIHVRIIAIWVSSKIGASIADIAAEFGFVDWYVKTAIERVEAMRQDDAVRFFTDAILAAARQGYDALMAEGL